MSATSLVLAFSGLIALTACSFAGFRRLALARGFIAHPSPLVRSHTDPVPYLGGLALFAALLPVLSLITSVGSSAPGDHPAIRWGCTAGMLAVGFLDDVRPLKVGPKLLAQSVVCSLYLVAVTPLASPGILSFALELALMLVLVNTFNLVDVMDGLLIVAASVATVGMLGGSFLTSPFNRIECWGLLAALGVAFFFNRPRARMFLGDAGALALGFFLASLYLTGASNSARPVTLAHLFAFGIPLFELALLTSARLRRGRSPLRASPDHFALRLQDQASWTPGGVLMATVAAGLFFDAWCFVPADQVLGAPGVILAVASIPLAGSAFACCWRLAPPVFDGDVRVAPSVKPDRTAATGSGNHRERTREPS